MNKLYTAVLLLFLSFLSQAQGVISLEKIWGGEYRAKTLESFRALKNSHEYTVLSIDPSTSSVSIDAHNFTTQLKSRTLFTTLNYREVKRIDNYSFDNAENKILIAVDSEPIYRHSYEAFFWVYDMQSGSIDKVSERKIQEPTFSPDGKKVAYVFENDLYYYDLQSKITKRITFDGKKNSVINGITDWVYEEEFGFVRAFEWNSDGSQLAFIRFDETLVPEFSMDVYGTALYPSQQVFKYPKAGEANAIVSLHIYDVSRDVNRQVMMNYSGDYYIPRIKWTNDARKLSVQVLNRHQNNLDLLYVDALTLKVDLILNEKDKAYVDIHDNLVFLKDHSFLWTSEKDGYNHLYHYNRNGKLINRVTKGSWEVTNFYGYDVKSKTVFYQSVERGSIYRDVYSIKIDGSNKKLLSKNKGSNRAEFSSDFESYILVHSNATTPPVYSLHQSKSGKELRIIENNEALRTKLANKIPTKDFFELKTSEGHTLNAYIIKPKNFDPSKRYPLLMFQYSGPGSQQVADQWLNTNDYWHMMLAEQGVLVACVDGRGTGYKGRDFKKITQKELGKYEVIDQIAAAKQLATYNYIDSERIGIWGWSYGGFMSSNCLLKGNDVFKMGIAVAPVTNWRFYDTIYTERYMQTPQENPSGYDDNSPINHVDKLKGKYLIIHGTADDNVHVQNAMRMIRALQLANKQFDQAVYPDTNHGIYGGKIRLQLYTFMTDYIHKNL